MKLSSRPEFTIKKRPKSLSNAKADRSEVGKSRYLPKKKSSDGYTTIGSTSRPLIKMDSVYVPWQMSSRR